jgi:hypothetical protein
MPHICKNWVQIEGSTASLKALIEKEFHPREWTSSATESALWMGNEKGTSAPIYLKEKTEAVAETIFFSNNSPPISFYFSLAVLFPDCRFTYEYNVPTLNKIGHGVAHLSNISIDLSYSSAKELEKIRDSRTWHLSV